MTISSIRTSSLTTDQIMKIKVILWNNSLIATDPEDLPNLTVDLFLEAMEEIYKLIQSS
jgi:hypothetical protein